MTTEATTTEEQVVEQPKGLSDILRAFPGAPSQEQVDSWKIKYGDVYVSGFSETELYIWRAVTRPEWVKLQSIAADPEQKVDQFSFEVMLCETCVLWSSVKTSLGEGKAGSASALQEQILQHSNFLTPQQAQLLVAKL